LAETELGRLALSRDPFESPFSAASPCHLDGGRSAVAEQAECLPAGQSEYRHKQEQVPLPLWPPQLLAPQKIRA
jgi:hypothetical protein